MVASAFQNRKYGLEQGTGFNKKVWCMPFLFLVLCYIQLYQIYYVTQYIVAAGLFVCIWAAGIGYWFNAL